MLDRTKSYRRSPSPEKFGNKEGYNAMDDAGELFGSKDQMRTIFAHSMGWR